MFFYCKSPFNTSQRKSAAETYIYGGAVQSGAWEFSWKILLTGNFAYAIECDAAEADIGRIFISQTLHKRNTNSSQLADIL